MSKPSLNKPVAIAIGAAFASSLAVTSIAKAATLEMAAPGQAQVLAAEGSCGGNKGQEGKCGGDSKGKGAAGGDKGKGKDKGKEGACGEGKCGGDMKPADPPK